MFQSLRWKPHSFRCSLSLFPREKELEVREEMTAWDAGLAEGKRKQNSFTCAWCSCWAAIGIHSRVNVTIGMGESQWHCYGVSCTGFEAEPIFLVCPHIVINGEATSSERRHNMSSNVGSLLRDRSRKRYNQNEWNHLKKTWERFLGGKREKRRERENTEEATENIQHRLH